MSKPASFYDSKGRLYVDCAECERGGNGSAKDKCACGFRIQRKEKGGCFIGQLMAKYDKNRLRRLKDIN